MWYRWYRRMSIDCRMYKETRDSKCYKAIWHIIPHLIKSVLPSSLTLASTSDKEVQPCGVEG